MNIGILGLTFHSGNKGCEALSYSFLELLNSAAQKRGERVTVNQILPFPTKRWLKNDLSFRKIKVQYLPRVNYSNLNFDCLFYWYRGRKITFLSSIKKCKCVFDYTAGDSFTDLYGKERFLSRTRCKLAVMEQGVPLVLGSQTIGPFEDATVRAMAVETINKAAAVYVRDEISYRYTVKISGRTPILTTDIAFALPYQQKLPKGKKPAVGFNPSGLLWNGGYTQNNQFDLTVDYPQYCRQVISTLLKDYEVHLIPHAFTDDPASKDNDYIAVDALYNEFPDTIKCPGFATPMEVKGYIAGMDVFIGARMHATIAAFSAGVPVIPFSYSRKFEGLFDSLGYAYIIHGKEETTEQAVAETLSAVRNASLLRQDMKAGMQTIKESNKCIENSMDSILFM